MKATRFCGLSQDLFWLAPAGATSAEILAARPSALLCSKRARSLSLLCRILLGNLEEGRHQNAEPKASFSPATDTGVREPRVVVPPSAPVGPLVVESVTEDSVRLSWKQPLKDGGDPVRNYLVEYRDVSAAEIAKFSVRTPDARTSFTVEDLRTRHFYVFRISAENEAGTGEALVDKKPVRVQAAPKKPPAPESPVVVIHPTMPDACIVTWSPPCDDITWYIVERCDLVGDVWIVVSQQKEAQFVAQNLVPGIEYSFRVSAENEVGMGKWSKPSEPIVIIRKAPPKLTGSPTYKDGLMFDSGETVRVKLSYTGHPPPDFTWRRNGEIVVFDGSSATMLVDRDDQTVLLKLVDADPNHRGMYTLEATNEHGSDQFSVAVMITGKMNNELWMKATTAHQEHCTVYGLIEGGQYAFRVRAVTVYGTSKPSQSSEPVTLLRLGPESRAESLPMETNSTEATEAIATEQDFASTADDATLTVTKYDSDDQRSSLDVDEFLNEDAAASETVSQVTAPAVSEWSDYDSLVPSSVVKVESGDITEAEYDALTKRASLEIFEKLGLSEAAVVHEDNEPHEEETFETIGVVVPSDAVLQKEEKLESLVREHSFGIVPFVSDASFDLLQEEPRYESGTTSYVPLTVSCVLTITSWHLAEESSTEPAPTSQHPLPILLVSHIFSLVVFSQPLLLDQTQNMPPRKVPDGIIVKLVTQAEYRMYKNLLPESSFLIIDVEHPLLVLAPPLQLESTSHFSDPDKLIPIAGRFTLSESLPVPLNYVIDTLLCEGKLRRPERPSTDYCSVGYVRSAAEPTAIVTTVQPEGVVLSVTKPDTPTKLSEVETDESFVEDMLEAPYAKQRDLLSASPSDSGLDSSISLPGTQWRPQGPLGLRTEDRRFYYYPDAQYYKTQARLKEFDMRTRRPYSRRITSLSKTIESDYSHRKSNMDRLAKKISSEMSSLERDLELLHSMQSMLRRELKTREKPTGEQTNGKTSNGRKSEGSPETTRARPYPDASSRPYLSRRLSRSDSESDEPMAQLPRPKPVPKGEAPRFITRLENRIAPSGYRVKLHCTVVGDPTPQVTWLKNGVKVSLENRQISINHQDYGLCSLEIFNLKTADTGEYTCTATNAYGEATTSAYLRVTGERDLTPEEPKFESCAPDLTVRAGGKAVFSWKASGSPLPTLKVTKDSKPLRTNLTTDVIISRDGICRVCLQKVSPADAGVYTCTAENDSGTAASTSILEIAGLEEGSSDFQEERRRLEKIHVDDRRNASEAVERASRLADPPYVLSPEENKDDYYKSRRNFRTYGMLGLNYLEDVPRTSYEPRSVPGPPLDPVVTESGPTSATLAWTKPISNGGHPITGYRIQYREVPSKQWRDKATSRICVCDIYGLKPQTEYVFQVSAGNKNGWGQPVVAVPELKNWRFFL
ncbi:twitchin [Ixodes scapularis]|uniref:twitchin n=1 Tax=Ixodes scapularis TaxID=6945 RepID=UPI001C380970|nr:twitchin [Ixodes scapularis]